MKQSPNVTLLGDTTGGGSANPKEVRCSCVLELRFRIEAMVTHAKRARLRGVAPFAYCMHESDQSPKTAASLSAFWLPYVTDDGGAPAPRRVVTA